MVSSRTDNRAYRDLVVTRAPEGKLCGTALARATARDAEGPKGLRGLVEPSPPGAETGSQLSGSAVRVAALRGMCSGGQAQNGTADTRIFSPRQSAPSSTQEHLKQPFRGNLHLGR